jgi:hypothetical protein
MDQNEKFFYPPFVLIFPPHGGSMSSGLRTVAILLQLFLYRALCLLAQVAFSAGVWMDFKQWILIVPG